MNLTNELKGVMTMKNENEKRLLTNEEMELVTGGGEETPKADDLSEQNKGEPEKNNPRPLPGGNVIS